MRTFTLPCPLCGEPGASIDYGFNSGEFHCHECDNSITVDEVKNLLDRWNQLMEWMEKMPPIGLTDEERDTLTGGFGTLDPKEKKGA